MIQLAPLVSTFFQEHLPTHRGCTVPTCEAYAHALRLLLLFAAERLSIQPSQLCLEHVDAALIMDFLAHIQKERGNSASTRNARLAAIKAFMRFIEFHHPSVLEQVRQIRAIPSKRHDLPLISHLSIEEIRALLNAPDSATRYGIRDRAMIHLCFAAALRVSELVGLPVASVSFHGTPSIRLYGKGRRERTLPLWKETAKDLRSWLAVRGDVQTPELFVNARGVAMSRSGFEHILKKHLSAAATSCPSLTGRTISPHQLRHSCAVVMLQATHDIRKVALWLGHADIRTTEAYLRIDPTEKLEAIEAVVPPALRRGRFKAPDNLIALLKGV